MQQYLELLKTIKEKGTHKPAARENMPGTTSLFGYQLRHNLQDGFPLLTTKKMFWKGVVVELLWFLKGDTNIKYLVDNGVNIWNEDAYQYYLKVCKKNIPMSFEQFLLLLKNPIKDLSKEWFKNDNYKLGDCGYQYGKAWRNWTNYKDYFLSSYPNADYYIKTHSIDQISNVINSLKNNPESRRHIVTAIDPAHDNDLALYWCHAMFQFNCRPLTLRERSEQAIKMGLIKEDDYGRYEVLVKTFKATGELKYDYDNNNVPKYYLDCQLYQRSADVFLGVPFNIASYALLTHIIAKICNMIPGEFIHTFGDVHIYDNHMEAVNEQLKREPGELPILNLGNHVNWNTDLDNILSCIELLPMEANLFTLENYNPQPAIKAELSTGLKK